MENLTEYQSHAWVITKREKHTIDVSDMMRTVFAKFKYLCLTIRVSGTSAKFSSGFMSRGLFNGIVVPVKKEYGGVADSSTFMNTPASSAVKYFENVIYVDTEGFPTSYEPGVIVIEGRN